MPNDIPPPDRRHAANGQQGWQRAVLPTMLTGFAAGLIMWGVMQQTVADHGRRLSELEQLQKTIAQLDKTVAVLSERVGNLNDRLGARDPRRDVP